MIPFSKCLLQHPLQIPYVGDVCRYIPNRSETHIAYHINLIGYFHVIDILLVKITADNPQSSKRSNVCVFLLIWIEQCHKGTHNNIILLFTVVLRYKDISSKLAKVNTLKIEYTMTTQLPW